ncbi:MAG: hypothetical protein R3F37_04220 [Candidatus Competibacteraceae bacterium]
MSRFLTGVLVSELFALWVEFFYKFGAILKAEGFVIAIPLYFFILCGLHGVFAKLEGLRRHALVCMLIGGVAGLMIEWFVVGNSPWQNPQVLQSGQFVFHAVYPILGYLMVRTPDRDRLTVHLRIYLLLATLIVALGFVMVNPLRLLWFIFLPLIAYCGLFYFIYKFAISKSRAMT